MSGSPLDGIRVVALDLDGTLLPSDKRVSDLAKRVVRDLQGAGIVPILATGRGWNSTAVYAQELALDGPLVTFEGALVAFAGARDGVARPVAERHLHNRTLGADLIGSTVRAIGDLEIGWFVCTDAGRTVVSRRVLEPRLDQVAVWDQNIHFVDGWTPAEERGYILHLVGPPGDVSEARARVHALAFDGVECFHAAFWDGYDQFQIRPRGIGKDAGLRRVLEHLGLGPEHLLAAGDWHNDTEMLRMARVAVAPANAVDEIRALAHHVLPGTNDDDAVVAFLDDALARRA